MSGTDLLGEEAELGGRGHGLVAVEVDVVGGMRGMRGMRVVRVERAQRAPGRGEHGGGGVLVDVVGRMVLTFCGLWIIGLISIMGCNLLLEYKALCFETRSVAVERFLRHTWLDVTVYVCL